VIIHVPAPRRAGDDVGAGESNFERVIPNHLSGLVSVCLCRCQRDGTQAAVAFAFTGGSARKAIARRFQVLIAPIRTVRFTASAGEKCLHNSS
jgi:hypothetical protein